MVRKKYDHRDQSCDPDASTDAEAGVEADQDGTFMSALVYNRQMCLFTLTTVEGSDVRAMGNCRSTGKMRSHDKLPQSAQFVQHAHSVNGAVPVLQHCTQPGLH